MKPRIKMNVWGNWNGYLGPRKVVAFGLDEADAKEWLATVERIKWREIPATRICAALSVWGDYVISYRPRHFVCSYRPNAGTPTGQHVHVCDLPTLAAAQRAAVEHFSNLSKYNANESVFKIRA